MRQASTPFTCLSEAPEELGETLDAWVIESDSEVAAALALEPLDPSGVIEDAERQAWIRRRAEPSRSRST